MVAIQPGLPVPVMSANGVPAQTTSAQLALQLGWTMAVLYGNIPHTTFDEAGRLPTTHELPVDERRALELGRLTYLLTTLSERPDCRSAGLPTDTALVPEVGSEDFKGSIRRLNLLVLKALARTNPAIGMSYELGRSIRDTVNPPVEAPGSSANLLATQLARTRVARMQDSLATLSTQYPDHAAAVVSASLGRWSELAELTVGSGKSYLKGRNQRAAFEQKMKDFLLPQGDVWLTLLVGALSTSGLLSPEGFVKAGQEALHRSAVIVLDVLKKYWLAVAIGVVLTAGVLFLAYINLSGAAKVWTYIAAISGAVGVSVKSLTSSLGRMSAKAEKPIFSVAQEDAMAWAVTTMPEVDMKNAGVRQLRRAGVTGQSELSRP